MKWKNVFSRIVVFLVIVLLWQISCLLGFINVKLLPPPIAVFSTVVQLFGTGVIFTDIFSSLYRVIVGFSLAAIFGILFGFLAAHNKQLGDIFISPIVELLRPVPPVAMIPIAIMWFGIGNGPAFFLVFFGAFFPHH